jgi:hypothetical protein
MNVYDYFQAHTSYFWQWEDNAEVIAIPNSTTIAYSVYITEALQLLEVQGLPPFGALLLAIIATNADGEKSLDVVNTLLLEVLQTADNVPVKKAFDFLKLLSQLPPDFKNGRNRLLVFQTIFEGCHNILGLRDSHAIVKSYVNKTFDKSQFLTTKILERAAFKNDYRALEVLYNKFGSTEEIIEKVKSLPTFNEEIELDKRIEEIDTKDFTEVLIANHKTFYVGSLIKRIWSGLNIPVHSIMPSEQPIGGVSDLTNKGDFDKLLVSEFANEDLIFLSRLANNEALFIRREIPPNSNNLERIILIDVSLKNWGTPKTMAFATMLAIAKHPKTTIACSAFAIGNYFYPLSIDSVTGIIDGLQILEGSLTPANGLAAFFKEFPNGKNREIFIITEFSTLKQAAMAKAMADYHSLISYWIYTDAEGNLDIYKRQQSSKKHIQHLLLPLEQLWKKEIKTSERKQQNDTVTNYPILFRSPLSTKKVLVTAQGEIFQITGERTLLRYYDKSAKSFEKGWEIMYEDLPFNYGEYEIGMLPNGEHVLLMFNPQNKEITLLNIVTNDTKKLPFTDWKKMPHHSFLFQDQMFHYCNYRVTKTIQLDGTIGKDSDLGIEAFKSKEKEIEQISIKYVNGLGVFKNIKEIFINSKHQLVINKHELVINQGDHIKLNVNNASKKYIESQKVSDTEFVFSDGSTIHINKMGLFVLKSSNNLLPTVYIPSVLNASLGVATDEYFSGNPFYFLEPQYKVVLQKTGSTLLGITKIVKDETQLGLKEAHVLVNEAPNMIIQYISKTKANHIVTKLLDHGATAEAFAINATQVKEQMKIDTRQFFDEYIQTFINTIIFNGTKN